MEDNSKIVLKQFTREEVAKHNTYEDAYIIIHNKVIDITKWGFQHPGGRVIFQYKGQDATEVFLSMHPDIKKSEKFFSTYLIGELSTYEEDKVKLKSNFEFRELIEEFRKKGYFSPSFFFYFLHFIQLIFLEFFAVFIYLQTKSLILTSIILSISQIQAGWLQHDFGHCSVFKSAFFNQIFHYVIIGSFKGASSWWWKSRHNRHHSKTNMIKLDPDIHTEPLFSFTQQLVTEAKFKPNRRFIPILKYQQYYWFLFGPPVVTTLLFLFENIEFMVKRAKLEDTLFVFSFYIKFDLIYRSYLGLSPLEVISLYFMMRFIETHWFTWVTSMNHLPMPKGEDKQEDWLTLQLNGTQNVTTGFFFDWFTGHLNYQIEHHLFPNMPRHSYPKISPIVQSLCAKYNYQYHQTTIWNSCVGVVKMLSDVAQSYERSKKSLIKSLSRPSIK